VGKSVWAKVCGGKCWGKTVVGESVWEKVGESAWERVCGSDMAQRVLLLYSVVGG
jgi:hypothetical protein